MMMVTTHKTRYEQKDAQTQTIGLDLNDNLDSAHYPSMCSLCREHNSKHHIPRLEMTFKWVPSTLTAKAQTQVFYIHWSRAMFYTTVSSNTWVE